MSHITASLSATPSSLLGAALAAAGLGDAAGLPLLAAAAKSFSDEFAGALSARLFNLSLSELRTAAEACAERYTQVARAFSVSTAVSLAEQAYGASIAGDTVESRYARISDPSFWSRYYLRQGKRAHEFAYIRAGFVSGRRELYVSDSTLNLYRNYQKQQEEFLRSHYVVDRQLNSRGEFSRRPLGDVAKSAEAKRAKLWAFLAGIEQLSVESGLSCALLTLTLPSSFHANPTTGRGDFDGVSTPRDGSRHLSDLWNKIQRDLDNRGIAVSGARFVEPHKDGTPHWHLWIHYQKSQLNTILAVIARYFPGDASKRVAAVRVRSVIADIHGKLYNKRDGSHFTEQFHRFDLKTGELINVSSRFKAQVDLSIINRAYANGATYASKYAMKTLTPGDTSERVAAARWVWRMRGFQLFGINRCLGAWDEFFRTKEIPADARALALFNAVHHKPGVNTVQIRNKMTGESENVEVEGGTAAFIRALGGLTAAATPGSVFVRIRLLFAKVKNRYGDITKAIVGFKVLFEDEYLFSSTTREPGRFVLISERNLEATISSLAPFKPQT